MNVGYAGGSAVLYIVHMRWHGCLRNCATRRKEAGSIPDGVIGNFH
jgi:hypothetical protein